MSPDTPVLSIIVPLHNEADGLEAFWEILEEQLKFIGLAFEVILIDDGSHDGTWAICHNLCVRFPMIRASRFTRNFGKEAAIQCGLETSRGRAVVVMDGDGQHPPALLPRMVDLWQKGEAQIVAARKTNRVHDSWIQRQRANLFNRLMHNLTGLELSGSTDFRLLDRSVVNALLACPETVRFFRGMVIWSGYETREIPFDVPPRLCGDGKWGTLALLKLALHAIVAYGAKPLYYTFGLGLMGLFFFISLTLQAIYSWLSGIAVNGWTSLTIVILFFGSMNLVVVGVLGLYVAQLFSEIKRRPLFFVAETLNEPPDSYGRSKLDISPAR